MIDYIDPPGKMMYHLDRIIQLRTGLRSAPVNVEIDLTNRCSRGCRDCHFAYTHTKGPLAGSEKPAQYLDTGDVMEESLALSLPDRLTMAGVRSITWSGGGEPTLHPFFNRVIDQNLIDQGVYTHGGHIDPERAEVMKQRCKWVYVSLDCPNEDYYSKMKGVPKVRYHEVVDGIENLVKAKGNSTIGLGFLYTPELDQDEAIELGRSLGVDYMQFRPTILYNQKNPSEAIDHPGRDISEYPHASHDVIIPWNRFHAYANWQGHGGYDTCWWSGLQTVITPNGKVWGCVNKRGYKDALLGDLTKQTFREIWDSAPLQDVNSSCRVMCRGHMPNLELENIIPLEENEHKNFI